MFKAYNKNIRTTSMTSFWYFYCNFEHISHISLAFLLSTLNKYMSAAPPNFRGNLKISNQNNWGGRPEQKIKFGGGGAKFKGGPEILGEAYEPQ